ncbi:transposase family protein [Glycomyces luteolus]|uniref:transposase family protein n=1 Tax=Glycomyces luteolus TaxID=2670330 RepID=UPI0038CC0D78
MRVRRPAEGSPNRDRFVSGKAKQNAVKTMVITDAEGRVLFCSPAEPGSRADITLARQLGLPDLLAAPRPPPRPPRAHERHHRSRRRTALTPTDRRPLNRILSLSEGPP